MINYSTENNTNIKTPFQIPFCHVSSSHDAGLGMEIQNILLLRKK